MRVELDKSSIFALASDTRLEILKALKPMRRTLSQLSEQLSIDKAAVHRHLKKMEDGGLVKRFEDHGFVYYGLTWMARDLLVPNESTRIVIVLSATWLLSLILAFVVAAGVLSHGGNDSLVDMFPVKGEGDDTSYQTTEVEEPLFYWLLAAVVLAIVVAVLCVTLVRMLRAPFQKSPESPDAEATSEDCVSGRDASD